MLDGIALELLWRRLISIVDEAAASLVRTSFSTVVRESNDFACVITDAQGRSIAQATNSIPSFIGTAPRTIRAFLDEWRPDDLHQGDILITNDVWLGTGHLPDITVARPIYLDGRLVALRGLRWRIRRTSRGRMRSADAREGVRRGAADPAHEGDGARRDEFAALERNSIRKNVRVPDQVMGDLYAQFTGLALIVERCPARRADARADGLASLDELSHELRSRSETAMRSAIRALPDGTYVAEAISDGIDAPITLKLALTIAGDRMVADFAGSDAQVPRSINVCLAYTTAYTAYGIKAVLCPDVPNNDGALAPLEITAPLGSILNSRPPAAGGARALIGHFLPPMVIGALAAIVPERAIAGVGSPLWCMNMAGTRADGATFAYMFFLNGGYGASATADGTNVLSWPSTVSSTPVEVIEQLAPLRVHSRRLRPLADANGAFRGGTGQELLLENRNPTPVTVSFLAERTKAETAAPGIRSGLPGAPGEVPDRRQASRPKSAARGRARKH